MELQSAYPFVLDHFGAAIPGLQTQSWCLNTMILVSERWKLQTMTEWIKLKKDLKRESEEDDGNVVYPGKFT